MCGAGTLLYFTHWGGVPAGCCSDTMAPVRLVALLISCAIALRAESHVTYDCPPEDIEQFGLNCSVDEPCTVLLELSAAEAVGNRIIVTGNLHTRDATLLSLLLTSD